MIGRTLAHYEILEKIGVGGMGEVYRARDKNLDRDVALKILPPDLATRPDRLARFRREAKVLASLQHPNIATIHDVGSEGETNFLVMELVPGETLDTLIAGKPLEERRLLHLAEQLCEGLAAAHRAGVIHRDLKPSNLQVTPEGLLKILDFGLAKPPPPRGETTASLRLTQTKAVLGTHQYMAPEQLRAQTVDARTDLYALGNVLYEMATGRRVFREDVPSRLTDAILHRPPVSPLMLNSSISPELERVILKCLQKDPELRYQHAEDIASDAKSLEATGRIATAARKPRTRRALVFVTLIAVLVVVGVLYPPLRGFLFRGVTAPEKPSVAVLYFQNFGEAQEDDHLAAGLTEDILTGLSQIEGLRVVSRSAMNRYRGQDVDPREVGRELSCGYVLEGSLRRAGHDLRVTAQLIDTKDNSHVWAHRYDRELKDVFAVQDTIASQIASALRVALTPEEKGRIARRWTENPEAYAYYLTGRDLYWNFLGPDSNGEARPWFDKALALDPDYAPALAALADCLVNPYLGGQRSEPGTLQRARRLVERAKRIDPSLSVAWRVEARIAMRERNLEDALELAEHARDLSPGMTDAYRSLAQVYNLLGQRTKAIDVSRRALEIDPDRAWLYTGLAGFLRSSGRCAEAETLLAKGLARLPDNPWLLFAHARILAVTGRLPDAIDAARQLLDFEPGFFAAYVNLTQWLRMVGELAESDSVAGAVIQKWPTVSKSWRQAAWHEHLRGRHDSAQAMLRKSVELDPYHYNAWMRLAECQAESGQTDAALQTLATIEHHWSDEWRACAEIAHRYGELQQHRHAVEWAQRAVSLQPRCDIALNALGWAHYHRGAYAEAIETFRQAIDLRPDWDRGYRGLARSLRWAGKPEEALAAAERALELNPTDIWNVLDVGWANEELGRLHQAATMYERALELHPTHMQTLLSLSDIYGAEGRYERQVETLRRAADVDTTLYGPWESLANAAVFRMRDYDLGREAASRALRNASGCQERAHALHILGIVETELGNVDAAHDHYAQAIAEIETALRESPENPVLVGNAGVLYARVGRATEAVEHAEWLQQRETPFPLYAAGCILAIAGHPDDAFRSLSLAVEAGFTDRYIVQTDPDLDALRDDPRFAEILDYLK